MDDALHNALRIALHRTRVAFDDYHGLGEKKARRVEWCAHCDIVAQKTIERMKNRKLPASQVREGESDG